VPDLDQWIAAMSERGIERPQIETVPGAGRKAPFSDPEGNTVTFIEVIPTDA
jgi:predicted enzyme related to lactoylglutathione lyase